MVFGGVGVCYAVHLYEIGLPVCCLRSLNALSRDLANIIRSVAELSEGWGGHLIKTQKYFIGLEGAIVSAGILALNIFHPGFCFREGDEARTALGRRKKTDRSMESSDVETVVPVTQQVKEM